MHWDHDHGVQKDHQGVKQQVQQVQQCQHVMRTAKTAMNTVKTVQKAHHPTKKEVGAVEKTAMNRELTSEHHCFLKKLPKSI